MPDGPRVLHSMMNFDKTWRRPFLTHPVHKLQNEALVCLRLLFDSHPAMHLFAAVAVQFLRLGRQLEKLLCDVGNILQLHHIDRKQIV